jgi:hypothetical protein
MKLITDHILLVADNFGIKYVGTEHAEHVKAWDYQKKIFDLSIPGYIKAALHKFQHPEPTRPENVPHIWNPPVYGAKAKFVEAKEDSPLLPQM